MKNTRLLVGDRLAEVVGGSGLARGRASGRTRRGVDVTDGRTEGEIVVLETLRDLDVAMLSRAAGVIVERGGPSASLATIARELRVPVVRLPDAGRLLPEGAAVTIDGATGTVHRLCSSEAPSPMEANPHST